MRIDILWTRYFNGSSDERKALEREIASEYGETFAEMLIDAFGSAECEHMHDEILAKARG